jgi:hypothetical protein
VIGELGIGFNSGPRPLSWMPVVNDRVAVEDVVVFYRPNTETALVYSRVLDGKRLEFEHVIDADGTALLRDKETGSCRSGLGGRTSIRIRNCTRRFEQHDGAFIRDRTVAES